MDAEGLLVGVAAVALGAAFMLLGYRLALLLLPIWGFGVGFILGAQVVAGLMGEPFLGSTPGWVAGVSIGLVFAVLSFVFWYAAVVIVFASIGYWLGWGVLAAVGFPDTGLEPFAIGLLVGAAFALIAVLTGVPLLALVVITALGGAHAVIVGLLLLLGMVEVASVGSGLATAIIRANIGWWLAALGLALVSIVVQVRRIGDFVLEPPGSRI